MLSLGQLYTDDNTSGDDDDDTNDGWQWHTMDKSWLHRLIGMYAKWAKKQKASSAPNSFGHWSAHLTSCVILVLLCVRWCLVFRKKDLYLIITQKLTFMKSGRFHLKSGGFQVKSTHNLIKSDVSTKTIQFEWMQERGYDPGFHEIRGHSPLHAPPKLKSFCWNIWFYKAVGGFHLKSAGFHVKSTGFHVKSKDHLQGIVTLCLCVSVCTFLQVCPTGEVFLRLQP